MKAPIALLILGILTLQAPVALAASQTSFTSATSTVQQGFIAVQTAGKEGGNVSSLVGQLNGALALIQKATSENASNPGQATNDLQTAIGIAQAVQTSATAVGQQGMAARQLQFELSITSAVVIVGIAVALYVFGDRIYSWLWLRMYSSHVVRKVG